MTERGRRQADRLAKTGELADASALLASVLPRAVQTAEIVAAVLGELKISQDCNFCQFHIGEAEGMSWEEFQERYRPDEHRQDQFRLLAPGAESWATFFTREGPRWPVLPSNTRVPQW